MTMETSIDDNVNDDDGIDAGRRLIDDGWWWLRDVDKQSLMDNDEWMHGCVDVWTCNGREMDEDRWGMCQHGMRDGCWMDDGCGCWILFVLVCVSVWPAYKPLECCFVCAIEIYVCVRKVLYFIYVHVSRLLQLRLTTVRPDMLSKHVLGNCSCGF